MAHWLKAAEDLFEVVDRRAKLVVGEKDELSNAPAPVSNGKGSQTKRSRSKAKAQKKLSSTETQQTNDASSTLNSAQAEKSDVAPEKEVATSILGNEEISPTNSSIQTSIEEQNSVEKNGSLMGAPISESLLREKTINDIGLEEVPDYNSILLPIASTSNEEITSKDSLDAYEEISSPIAGKGIEIVEEHAPPNSGHNVDAIDAGTPIKSEEEHKPAHVGEPSNVNMQPKDAKIKVEPYAVVEKHQVKNADSTPTEVQDQLDEAQGLLKSAISTGQSKEARLARVCAGLSSRLQEYKSESSQLEELLIAERELSKSYEVQIKQLQKDLSESKSEATRVESSMAEALAAKNSEIEALVSSMDAVKKQASLAEGNLASIQANMESIMRNRELTETRMMQALREELSSVERRAEEERAAHHATKMAAMEREVELEHRALEASTALARIQRTADERMTKATELEQKMALLEVECASLNQELQDMETRTRREQKKPPEEANQMIQAWQEEVERARQLQRDAESKLSVSEAELQKLRVEMAAMKRDAEHYSRQEHMELEKRYRELTDLLYYKQTQLEAMASEKAAAEFQLEKEMRRLQEAQVEAERSRVSRRASSSWEEDSDLKALEPLPLHHRHMAAASIQLQKAAKFLDTGAVRATRFLWRYPTARISLFCYLVFVHLFLMYLLHRLQEQADTLVSRELAESMGLANHTLP